MSANDRASQPDAENPEWTDEMVAGAVRLDDLPAGLQGKLRGRPKAAVTKEPTTIRLSPEVLEHFRATGPGWQSKIDAVLKDWVAAR